MFNKSGKVLQYGSIFLVVLSNTNSIYFVYQNSRALVRENEETAYLKFVSQAVKESDGSSSSKNSTASAIQIPEAAKGPPIPAKGYLVQEIRDHLYWVTDGSYNSIFLVTDGKIGLAERSSSCQPIALLWLNRGELILQYRHYSKTVRLYTNDWSTYS
jgi:hypothetical protein